MFQRGKDSDENLVLRQCENILLKNMKDSGRHIRQKTLDCRRKKSTCLDSTMGRQDSCQNCKAARIDGDLINKAVDMDVAKHAATCDNKIVGSLEAQLELLRSELTLSRNQVKERNAQLRTLETLVNHQSDVMKHSCEGSTSLSKVVQLIQVAVELQNQQVANIKNIEKRIKLLERPRISQVCLPTCKTLEKRDPCKMQCRLNAPDQGKYQAVTRNEATQYDADPSGSRVLITSVDKTVASEELNPKETIDKRLYDEMRSQFEDKEGKLKRMNCQMSDTIKTLEDQIQFLKKKLEKLDEEKSTALESVKRSNEENRTLQQQLTSLTEQNSRSSVNIRKLDEERDKIIKELDSADEEIAKLKTQLRTADERGAGFEAQYKSSAEQNCKLQELLRNSEGIVENLKKQKLDLSREVGEANGKFADLQKSYDTLRIRLHHSLKQLKKFKKDFIKANEEKTVLQAQLQDYVSKVRGIEDLLLQKEQEREFMFEQFREMTERSKGTLSDSNANTRSHVEEDAIHCSEWQSDVNILSEEESSIESNLLPKAQRTLCKSDAEIQTDLLTHPKVRFIDKSINSTKETEELEAALSLEKKTTEKLHDVIKVTREEAIEANMKNEQLTLQLEAMKITVQQLEAQVKTIASSMGNYRRQCMEEESLSRQNYGSESDASRERRHYNCSESSHSTML